MASKGKYAKGTRSLNRRLLDAKQRLVKLIGLRLPFEAGKRTLVRRYIKSPLQSADREDNNVAVITRHGLEFELDLSQEIDLWIYLTGWWEKSDMRLALAALEPGDIVLDIGANIGFFSLHAAMSVGPGGHVYAFEPDPISFARLTAHARRNRLNQITPVEVALGDFPGQTDLFVPADGRAGDASLLRTYSREDTVGTEPSAVSVRLAACDSFCLEHAIDQVDFVKIDAEGSEPAILNGARETIATHKPRMMVECNERALAAAGWNVADFLNMIWDLGYETWRRPLWSTRLRPVRSEADLPNLCNLHCLPDYSHL